MESFSMMKSLLYLPSATINLSSGIIQHQHPSHRGFRRSASPYSPSIEGRAAFRDDVSQHVRFILTKEVSSWSHFCRLLPKFTDPDTLPPHKTKQYFLPTFDQEQGSVRGNMVVLRHYFLKVLKVAKEFFETNVISALGDRLTTAASVLLKISSPSTVPRIVSIGWPVPLFPAVSFTSSITRSTTLERMRGAVAMLRMRLAC